jgi:hypothetical protein
MVEHNRHKLLQYSKIADELGLVDPLPDRGPFGEADLLGHGATCVMLVRSLDSS